MPSSAASRNTSTGKCLVASHSSACGARRLSAKAAAVWVITRSSSLRAKSCMVRPALIHCRDAEFGAIFDSGGPSRRDGFGLGVELDRRRAVLVEITDPRTLPAAETVISHRDRDRHVDPDHTHLHTCGEVTGGVAVTGENRH